MCPHLKYNKGEFYCGKDYRSNEPEWFMGHRIGVCDPASLDLWCQTKDRYPICIVFQGGIFRQIEERV